MGTSLTYFISLFIAWLLYVVVQAIFINGIKLSAAGSTEILPNGEEKDSEMILYPVAKFLLQKKTRKIFYSGVELEKLYTRITDQFSALGGLNSAGSLLMFATDDQHIAWKHALPMLAQFGAVPELSHNTISFYKEVTEYKFSKWLRKPVIECVVCMSSFYGIFTCLIPFFIVSHYSWLALPVYLLNTFSLACMNKIIFKLT
jgi:hypothetical protein